MSGQLFKKLKERKDAINTETLNAKAKYKQLEVDFPWLAEDELPENFPIPHLKEFEAHQEMMELNDTLSKLDLAERRIRFFSMHYSKSFTPLLCFNCFVVQNAKSSMNEVQSERGGGIRQFECPVCELVLHLDLS